MFLDDGPEHSLQKRLLERREFLKGITSIAMLALLSAIVPFWLRKNGKTPAPVSPTAQIGTYGLSESGTSVPTDEKARIETRGVLGVQNQMPLAMLYQEGLKEYNFGTGRLYDGTRYQEFMKFLLETLPEDDNYRIIRADPATDKDLLLISSQEYINVTRDYFKAANLGSNGPEQFYQFHSKDTIPGDKPGKVEEAARLIVGQAKTACNLVQKGQFNKAVSIGGGLHHAKPNHGEAFCIYNDVASCSLYLMQEYGLERILVLDTDAHAANGTSDYFYEDPRVLLIDLHQDPRTLYPGTGFANEIGCGKGRGFTINVPMPIGADDNCYQLVFESIVEPVAQEFKPQIIIWEGGSDPHFADPLTELRVTTNGFKMMGKKVAEMANICDGKVIYLTCSGYNEKYLPYTWLAAILGLGGIEFSLEKLASFPEAVNTDFSPDRIMSLVEAMKFSEVERVIQEVRKELKDYWTF